MPRTVTFANETWNRLLRAAEALAMTPDALAERVLSLMLASCEPGMPPLDRGHALADLQDLRWGVLDAAKGEQRIAGVTPALDLSL